MVWYQIYESVARVLETESLAQFQTKCNSDVSFLSSGERSASQENTYTILWEKEFGNVVSIVIGLIKFVGLLLGGTGKAEMGSVCIFWH